MSCASDSACSDSCSESPPAEMMGSILSARRFALSAALRAAPAPIFSRVNGGKVLLDFRTLLPGEEALVLEALEGL